MCDKSCNCACCKASTLRENYVIVRTRHAGVFAGVLPTAEFGSTVTLKHARRLWYWCGAASLSDLSLRGVQNPSDCKFPAEVPNVYLPEVIEILPVSDAAQASIARVKIWQV